MTAINVLLLDRQVHVFSDGAYYDTSDLKTICGTGNKVIPLPAVNGFLAWSGPLDGLYKALGWIERSGHFSLPDLVEALPKAMRGLRLPADYSVIVCGVPPTGTMGVSCEGSGKVHRLSPRSVVKSLACDSQFDIADIEGSGLRILEEQKARYEVVGAFAQHHVFVDGGHTARTLKRWPVKMRPPFAADIRDLAIDRPDIRSLDLPGTRPLRLAKIADLTVETLDVAPNDVNIFHELNLTPAGAGNHNIVASNPESAPVQIYVAIHFWVIPSALGVTGGSSVTVSIIRNSNSELIYTQSLGANFNGNRVDRYDSFFAVDDVSGVNENFRVNIFYDTFMTSGGSAQASSNINIKAVSTTR